jgi:23S rRNA (adenine1618-N6)-methyltransferase
VWPTEYPIIIPEHTKEALTDSVNSTLSELSLDWSFDPGNFSGLGISRGNVWSRHARRKRKLQEMSTSLSSDNSKVAETNFAATPSSSSAELIPEMVFRVSISTGSVTLRWLKGVDEVLWDSFCGMMRRKLTGNVATLKSNNQAEANGGKIDQGLGTEPAK